AAVLASAKIFLRSATPENTADTATNLNPTASARRRAMLVLPVPGGPHRIIDANLPAATIRPIAPSGPVRCSCPTTSWSAGGRSWSASGALAAGASGGRVGISWSANRSGIGRHHRAGARNCTSRLAYDATKIYLRHIEKE